MYLQPTTHFALFGFIVYCLGAYAKSHSMSFLRAKHLVNVQTYILLLIADSQARKPTLHPPPGDCCSTPIVWCLRVGGNTAAARNVESAQRQTFGGSQPFAAGKVTPIASFRHYRPVSNRREPVPPFFSNG